MRLPIVGRWSSVPDSDKVTLLGFVVPVIIWWLLVGRNRYHVTPGLRK